MREFSGEKLQSEWIGIRYWKKQQLTLFHTCYPVQVPGLFGCFGFNGPLRQFFSLYRAVFQTEAERGWLVVLELTAL